MSWTEMIATVERIEADLRGVHTDDDVRSIGTSCREAMISLARLSYSPERHLPPGETAPGASDSERMLGLVLDSSLEGSSATEARAFVRTVLKLSHAVVHRRPSSIRDAKLAVVGLRGLIETVGLLAGENLQTEPWVGVRVGPRFFAWDGPTLHALEDRPPIPAPDEAIAAIKAQGLTPFFGQKAKLRRRLAEGAQQVYETDRRSWRKELLHSPDGSQVLLVKQGAA